jgi:hypothetical protein
MITGWATNETLLGSPQPGLKTGLGCSGACEVSFTVHSFSGFQSYAPRLSLEPPSSAVCFIVSSCHTPIHIHSPLPSWSFCRYCRLPHSLSIARSLFIISVFAKASTFLHRARHSDQPSVSYAPCVPSLLKRGCSPDRFRHPHIVVADSNKSWTRP